jgi:phenylpropionate dioxygenase-like ring-hydroxylating dioxygenase large terminal subunit
MFLRDHWYVAAFDDEVGNSLLARTILGEALVLFRRADGGIVALEDRCAHRRLPLSAGRLIGDTVECGYHGLVYDTGGRCIKIPGQKIPGQAHGAGADAPLVRAYPAVERHRMVYVWMGDPARADPATIISFPRLSDPASGVTKVRLTIKANHLLVLDNLLDLSHIAYVHNSTIGNAAVAEQAAVKTKRLGQNVRVTREMNDVPAPPTYAEFGPHQGQFDRWQLSEFRPPGYFWINNGSAACGWRPEDGGDRILTQGEWGFEVYHGITPETETSTHQFWTLAHALEAVPPDGRDAFYRQCHAVVYEDLAIYDAQQRSLDGDPRGASADDVGSAIAIDADRALLLGRQVLKELQRAASNHV